MLLKDCNEQASTHADSNIPSINPFLLKFLLKIVKNIVIDVTNVHIRYEDAISIPAVTLAVGLTIDRFSVANESDDLARLNQRNIKYIPKVITITDLCIYHNEVGSSGAWEQHMQSLIYNRTSNKVENNYIVSPFGLTIKLIYDNTEGNALSADGSSGESGESKTISKVVVVITSEAINVKVLTHSLTHSLSHSLTHSLSHSLTHSLSYKMDKIYLLQYCKVVDYFNKVNRRKYLQLLRPVKRPSDDPRAWWRYALVLLTGKEDDILLSTAVTNAVEKYQKKYLELLKKEVLHDVFSSKQKKLLHRTPTKKRNSITYLEGLGVDSSAIGIDGAIKQAAPLNKDEAGELRRLTRELPIQGTHCHSPTYSLT